MAGIVGLYATIGEHLPIFKMEKRFEPKPEGNIHRLHYRGTCLLILVFEIMVSCTEWISGTGSIIDCIHGGSLPDKVINQYCWISGTFSIPTLWRDHNNQIGYDVSQTGVGPYNPRDDYIQVKAYYQWVPFVLFLQCIMFYVPHVIFKWLEGGKVRNILQSLNLYVLDDQTRNDSERHLADYFVDSMGMHDGWTLRLLFGNSLYLANVIFQIFFTDLFLGGEFTKYGVKAASFLSIDEVGGRIDPMSRVFPRVTKCTFHKYGPSGSIQRHDAQCVLPINIINEKIYVFLWFWFMILAALTILDFLHHISLIVLSQVRWVIIKRKLQTAPKFKLAEMTIDIDLIARSMSYGDWKLLYHILRNLDSLTFAEWMQELTYKMQKNERDKNPHDSETLPLKSKMRMEDEKESKI